MLEVPCLDPNYSVLEDTVPRGQACCAYRLHLDFSWALPLAQGPPHPEMPGSPALHSRLPSDWLIRSYLLASRHDELWCHLPSGAQNQAEAGPQLRWHPCSALSPSPSCSPHTLTDWPENPSSSNHLHLSSVTTREPDLYLPAPTPSDDRGTAVRVLPPRWCSPATVRISLGTPGMAVTGSQFFIHSHTQETQLPPTGLAISPLVSPQSRVMLEKDKAPLEPSRAFQCSPTKSRILPEAPRPWLTWHFPPPGLSPQPFLLHQLWPLAA